MLLMMDLNSVVWVVAGIEDRSGEHSDRREMLKICVALIKEKDLSDRPIS
jgi:hypothetical protein